MTTRKQRVAVIGGGIFGTTAAIYAAREGHNVHLFEALDDILQAASGINQYRLHRGYHYPRSPETIVSSMGSESLFRAEYGESVIDDGRNIYAIAKGDTKTTAEQFLATCDQHNLKYRVIQPEGLLNPDNVALCVEAEEAWYDPYKLKSLVVEKLREAGVSLHLHTRVADRDLEDFDQVVLATYANMNTPLSASLCERECQEYQFELCEKPVVALPETFGKTGIVVLDGPFMCVDPLGRTGYYVLGNVVHAIHTSSIGLQPDIPHEYQKYLNRGVIKRPSRSSFSAFIDSGKEFIPILAEAEHIGSMYTVRTVLPQVDATDERPTTVKALDERHIRIFSGKVGNCVEAAKQVIEIISGK